MVDRVVDLEGIPVQLIKDEGYDYLLQDEYLVPEAILVSKDEIEDYKEASRTVYMYFRNVLQDIIKNNDWSWMDVPIQMQELVKYSWENRQRHVIGRFDFAGGLNDSLPKLLEYNADTPTMVPESSIVQDAFRSFYSRESEQMNKLDDDLLACFNTMGDRLKDNHHSILFTSLGYPEDRSNLQPIMDAAAEAGFDVAYSDLEHIDFAAGEGVFLEDEEHSGEFIQYDYLYKLVPWEFIVYEEPALLSILHDLIINNRVYVMNPPYTFIFQSKAFMCKLYETYPDSPYLLKTVNNPYLFSGQPYVEKVIYGRLGENIKIYNQDNKIVEQTSGDFGGYKRIYQEYVPLYRDEDGDVYQASVFTVRKKPSTLSFRRCDKLIIDDDAEFIPHLIF